MVSWLALLLVGAYDGLAENMLIIMIIMMMMMIIIINTGILVPNIAAILHLVHSVRLLCWTSMLWSIDTCQNKVSDG